MQLAHIDFDHLCISALNMRHGRKAPDVSDILPSIRARGVLVPLLVRPNGMPESYEVIAGRRRYFSVKAVKGEGGEVPPLPCAILEEGDDAAALEASLIENIARLDPDEMTQYETFARLVKQGRNVPDIAATFGITERQVTQRLALGNLLPRIRAAYRADEIDAETMRHLTLASKSRQKDWLGLFEGERSHAPLGSDLKHWLFGGQSISTKVAIFPLEDYPGEIVSDLFGEERYFADATLFWQKQNEAVVARKAALVEAGWREVIVLETGTHFHAWEHEKTARKKGGKVYIEITQRGEVVLREGYLSRKEAARAKRTGEPKEGGEQATTVRSEVSSVLQNYLDLHRQAAVRAALMDAPDTALRLMVAHAIGGSGRWQVRADPQTAKTEAIPQSVAAGAADTAFRARQSEIAALLGPTDDRASVVHGNGDSYQTVAIFARLLALPDDAVMRVLALVMAETLEAGSAVIEAAGVHLKLDLRGQWQADDTFLELVRDRPAINALLDSVAGKAVAEGNLASKAKDQRQIIRDCLNGTNGRTKVESWLPGWMTFPPRAVTAHGTLESVAAWERVRALLPQG
jgi:ParB family transcriptional regulator, chromosome partitioning protein